MRPTQPEQHIETLQRSWSVYMTLNTPKNLFTGLNRLKGLEQIPLSDRNNEKQQS